MSLNASKTILKIFGIISIIFGVMGIIAGILFVSGGAFIGAGAAAGDIAPDTQLASGIAVLGFGGLLIIIGSAIELLSGVFSVKAANDSSKIMPAWWFALLGTITSVISIITMFVQKTQPVDTKNVFGAAVGVFTSILIFVAANTIKQSAGK